MACKYCRYKLGVKGGSLGKYIPLGRSCRGQEERGRQAGGAFRTFHFFRHPLRPLLRFGTAHAPLDLTGLSQGPAPYRCLDPSFPPRAVKDDGTCFSMGGGPPSWGSSSADSNLP